MAVCPVVRALWSGANAGVGREEKRSRETVAPTGSGVGEYSCSSTTHLPSNFLWVLLLHWGRFRSQEGSNVISSVRPGYAILTGQ